MVEELAEAVVRATSAAARGVAALLSVPETYSAAAEFAAAKAEQRDDDTDETADETDSTDETDATGETDGTDVKGEEA
ncbi:hypothetical protein [Streptomyces sp. CC208A]|uniref:hypothetical protein n=1 Tax=Streptomyces sp. CC208A TaxID=3044573 RepID=UPI0024A87FD3|nr:hypothetical protein [Streptomyces sp. CC208A]